MQKYNTKIIYLIKLQYFLRKIGFFAKNDPVYN